MPRIHVGPRVSSLPPRQWAGVPLSWCKCHCHQSGERVAESCYHLVEGTGVVGRCSRSSVLSRSDAADLVVQGKGTFEELMVCSREIAASTAQLVAASKVGVRLLPCPWFRVMLGHHVVTPDCGAGLLLAWWVVTPSLLSWQVKADKDSANLCKLQQASRGVNQATASVVASTKAGKSQVEEKGKLWAARILESCSH